MATSLSYPRTSTYSTQPAAAPTTLGSTSALPTGQYTIAGIRPRTAVAPAPIPTAPKAVAPAPVAAAPAPATNTVAPNPDFQAFMDQMKQRIATSANQEGKIDPLQQEQINNYRSRLGADTTQRATDVANQSVNNSAAAAQSALQANLARRGMAGNSGVAAELGGRISDQAQRLKAGNAAQISLGREGQKDQLVLGGNSIMQAPSQTNLAQQGQTNSLYGAQLSGVSANASNQLGQQNLALSQLQGQQQTTLAQQQLAQQAAAQKQAQQLALMQMYTQSGTSY